MFHIFQLRQKILEAHVNVKDLNLLEAKMNFIKAWQSLPDYGVSLFVVRFHGEKREELLGVAFNRIMRMSLQNGDHIKNSGKYFFTATCGYQLTEDICRQQEDR